MLVSVVFGNPPGTNGPGGNLVALRGPKREAGGPRQRHGADVRKQPRRELLAQVELFEDDLVAVGRGVLEVIEEGAAFCHHHEEAAAGGMILDVGLEVLGELVDALGEERDLHISAAGVLLVDLEALKVLGLCCHIFF